MSGPTWPRHGSLAVIGVVAAMYLLPVTAETLGQAGSRAGEQRLVVLAAVYGLAACIGIAAWLVRRRDRGLIDPPAVAMDRRILLIAVLTGAGLAALFLTDTAKGPAAGPVGSTTLTAAAVFGAVAATTVTPVVEELVFRGVLYQHVRRASGSMSRRWPWAPLPVVAVVVSSALFAASHYRVRSIGGMALLVGVGVVLAVVYEATGRLWAPIVIHAALNLSAELSAHDVGALTRATVTLGLLIVATVSLGFATGPEPPVIGRDPLRPLGTEGWRRHVYIPDS